MSDFSGTRRHPQKHYLEKKRMGDPEMEGQSTIFKANANKASRIIHTSTAICVVRDRDSMPEFTKINDDHLHHIQHSTSNVFEFAKSCYREAEVTSMVSRMNTRRNALLEQSHTRACDDRKMTVGISDYRKKILRSNSIQMGRERGASIRRTRSMNEKYQKKANESEYNVLELPYQAYIVQEYGSGEGRMKSMNEKHQQKGNAAEDEILDLPNNAQMVQKYRSALRRTRSISEKHKHKAIELEDKVLELPYKATTEVMTLCKNMDTRRNPEVVECSRV